MKNTFQSLIGILFILLNACESKNENNMDSNQTSTKQFATSAEAVAKGKNDLLEILRTDKNNVLHLDPALVEKAQVEESITAVDIDLQKLMNTDSLSSMKELISKEKGRITPLYADNKLVTTIHTRMDNGGWSVSGIKEQFVEAELNEMRNSNPAYSSSDIIYFEIPNIDAHVYAVNNGGQEFYYTNYKGMSLAKPISIKELIPILKQDALAFEREYGEQLKKGNLVK